MVSSPMENGLIHSVKISSIGPANVTAPDLIFEPGNMDLAMKLHYLRLVYYFRSEAFEGLNTLAIKEPMFTWLNKHPVVCGRFRRNEAGRAFVKCNDCGVRFIEAKCDKTLDEWLEMKDDIAVLERNLVSNQCIGPELGFSPLVFIQLTKYKCGGMAVGLSWAHVLGDAYSAAEFMNTLGRVVAGHELGRPINLAHTLTKPTTSNDLPKAVKDPLSVKRVEPVGDNWVNVTKSKMEPFSFSVTSTQLSHLQSRLSSNGAQFAPFEALTALIWQCIAKIRGQELEPNVVTICKRGEQNKVSGIGSNSQVVSVVRADFPIVGANPSELASLVKNRASDERKKIEEAMERDQSSLDLIVYGANLTFVDFGDVKFHEFEYRGQKPVSISCRIDGVGDEGAVLVLPRAEASDGGRGIMVIMPDNEICELKLELKREGLMA